MAFKGLKAAGTRRAQMGLEVGEDEFDRVEIRGIGREKAQVAARCVDRLPDVRVLVDAQVVQDDGRARCQSRH